MRPQAPAYASAGEPDRFVTSAQRGFYRHLQDAIRQNSARKSVYSRLSQGQTEGLSNELVWLERLTLLPAALFDHRAIASNQRGIPVVAGDFVTMESVRPPTAPPKYYGQADEQAWRDLKRSLASYQHRLSKPLKQGDFAQVAQLTFDMVTQVEQLEESTQSHFAMTRHILDSIGYAAVNAARYQPRGDREALGIWHDLIRMQALGFDGALSLDRRAQVFQARGIGIIVNDVPSIPFKETWLQVAGS